MRLLAGIPRWHQPVIESITKTGNLWYARISQPQKFKNQKVFDVKFHD